MIKRNNKITHQKLSQSAFQNLVNLCHGSLIWSHWHLSLQQHCQKWLPYRKRVCRQVFHHSHLQCQQWPVSNNGEINITSTPRDYLHTKNKHLGRDRSFRIIKLKVWNFEFEEMFLQTWVLAVSQLGHWFIIPGSTVTFIVAIWESFRLIRRTCGKLTNYINDKKSKAEEWFS